MYDNNNNNNSNNTQHTGDDDTHNHKLSTKSSCNKPKKLNLTCHLCEHSGHRNGITILKNRSTLINCTQANCSKTYCSRPGCLKYV